MLEEKGERDVIGAWGVVMLSGRVGTGGASEEEVGASVDAEIEGTGGAGSASADMVPARSQGFGGEPITIEVELKSQGECHETPGTRQSSPGKKV